MPVDTRSAAIWLDFLQEIAKSATRDLRLQIWLVVVCVHIRKVERAPTNTEEHGKTYSAYHCFMT